ncbi:arabinosidase [Apiospora saccharicola]
MDEPLLLAQFGSASSTAPPTSQDGIHDMPKLLALGILLLEIETRTFIEGHRENPGLNPTETVDMDTDYRIARRIVDVNDPQNILSEMQTTSPLTTVLPLCVVAVESAVRRAKAKAILIFSAASNQRNMDEIYCPANLDDCVFGIFAANAGNRESRDLNPSMALTPADPVSLRRLPPTEAKRADTNLVGYLGAFFLGADPYVYFYQSNGNNPVSFRALNRAEPVIRPTKGTGGVRDPAIVQGSGEEEGKKWYIVGTDLNIGKTNWDAAQRTGSRGIFVWESIDLVNWGNERLVVVEDSTAGMVWAPEALWDASQEQYLVHWASKFYSASDTRHTGTPSNIRIRYAYTRDFRTFTAPQTYIDRTSTSIIDLDILPLYPDADNQQYVRFMKDETRKTVFMEYSTTGLFGNWTRAGGGGGTIASQVEGPAAYRDNLVDGKVHVLLDFYGGDGYRPYESTGDLRDNRWTASSRNGFPSNLRHGSVLPVNQTLFDALSKKWGS